MKIFTGEQIYLADKFTIENQQISSDELMERAASQLFQWLDANLKGANLKIHLFCGIGNNGGDGIALARYLLEHNYDIAVYVVNYSEKRSKDFLINLDRLKERKCWPVVLNSDSILPEISPNDFVVDAIFGIGLNRNPDVWVKNLITHINSSKAYILAVDIPSGMFADKATEDFTAVIKANYVLSFQLPKLVFFLPETGPFITQWQLLDIGLDHGFIQHQETDFELISKYEVVPMYRPRNKFSHKGDYGHTLVVGGSYSKIGAVQLSATACLKIGAGLVTALVPNCGYLPLQCALPEVMVRTSGEEQIITIDEPSNHSVIIAGMGLGTSQKTKLAFKAFLKDNKQPLVLDADALNILASENELQNSITPGAVLTPHPGELKRLIGDWKDDFEKLALAKAFSKKHDVVLVLKGAHTITIYQDKGYVNTTGNPGMATAGSGDVLAGIIGGLISQGYNPLNASIFGVFLHGFAADIAASKMGYEAIIASTIIEYLPEAFMKLFTEPEQLKDE